MLSRKGLPIAAFALLGALISGACGGGEPGPTAPPADVVAAAPDVTFSTVDAAVSTAAPGVTAKGRASFRDNRATLAVAPRRAPAPFGVKDPIAVVDLVRGVVDVRPYGGSEVQGVGTKRYELVIDVDRAIDATPPQRREPLEALRPKVGEDGRVWGIVFVDSGGRIRRTLLPVKLESERPSGRDKRIPQYVSVDFYEFGGRQ